MQKEYFSKLQLPDFLSIFRIIAAAGLLVLAYYDMRQLFSWLLIAGLATDALDGFIARNYSGTTEHGAKLDSAGDATIFMAAAVGVYLFEKSFFEQYLMIIAITFGIYFLQLGLAYWRYGKSSSFHTYAAKTAAVAQGIFLIYTCFFGPVEWMFYIVVCISILETLEEIILIFIFEKPAYNVKGLYWVKKEGKEKFM